DDDVRSGHWESPLRVRPWGRKPRLWPETGSDVAVPQACGRHPAGIHNEGDRQGDSMDREGIRLARSALPLAVALALAACGGGGNVRSDSPDPPPAGGGGGGGSSSQPGINDHLTLIDAANLGLDMP